jgi:hypothetical protein
VVVLGCGAVGFSLVGRSRIWLHTTGKLHIWYHLVLFGVLGALAVRASRGTARRVVWVGAVVLLGLGMEWLQGWENAVRIEWVDVQMDCFGVAFGCFAVWLMAGKARKVR